MITRLVLILLLFATNAVASPIQLFEAKQEFYFPEPDNELYTFCATTDLSEYLMIDLPDQYQSLQIVDAYSTDEVSAFTYGLLQNKPLLLTLSGFSDGRPTPYPNLSGATISYYEIEVPYNWSEEDARGGPDNEDWGVLLRAYGSIPEPSSLFLCLFIPFLSWRKK